MDIFIYSLSDPETQETRYVGKTKKRLKKRLYEHLTVRNLIPRTHKNCWIKSLLRRKLKPLIILLEVTDENSWKEREIHWIRSGCFPNLTNGTDGGDGALGTKSSPEQIRKRLETSRLRGVLRRSDECRRKISLANRGRKLSERHILASKKSHQKRLMQKSLAGELLKTWDGVRDCCKQLGICRSSLWLSIKHSRPYRDFLWAFADNPSISPIIGDAHEPSPAV